MILRWFVTIVPCFAFVPKEPTSYAEVQFFILALLLDRNSSKCCQFVCVCVRVSLCVCLQPKQAVFWPVANTGLVWDSLPKKQ